MTLTTTIVGFGFILEDKNLLFFALSNNFPRYFSSGYDGSSDFQISFTADSEYFVKNNSRINFSLQFFNKNRFAFLNTVLLTARFILAEYGALRT